MVIACSECSPISGSEDQHMKVCKVVIGHTRVIGQFLGSQIFNFAEFASIRRKHNQSSGAEFMSGGIDQLLLPPVYLKMKFAFLKGI